MNFDDEYDESEVMFSDYSSDESVETSEESDNDDRLNKHYFSESNHPRMMLKSMKSYKKKQPRASSSLPVNIPMLRSLRFDIDPFDEDDDDNNEDRTRRLPPHLIVERRENEEMARSFSPLKGKNLCQVRNSILRMTGFLER